MIALTKSESRNSIKKCAIYLLNSYRKLPVFGKLFIWLLSLFYICVGILVIVVTPARIAQSSYDLANDLASTKFGWLILGAAMICVCFPPMVGHTTLITLAGFSYGMKGFYISSISSVFGSVLAFTVLRFFFMERLKAWSGQNEKWQALESVLSQKGLPLIILIRISPFPPWVYSNSLFASIEAVNVWQFVVATLFVLPKITLHTFIGSKLAVLSDGGQRGRMDSHTKLLNGFFLIGGIAIAIFTSWTVYNLVQHQIKHLKGFSPELAVDPVEDEEAPLLDQRR